VPDVGGLVVVGEDGDVEPVFVELEILGEKFPGVSDGFLLEIVAEGEVTEHLEEGVMASGAADVLEIVVLAASAHALLAGGGAHILALLVAEEAVLELVHAGVGEEQGRVVMGNQRRGGDHRMAALLEKTQETGAEFFAGNHGLSSLPLC